MYIGYITLLKLCIKGTYSSQPMVCLPANDATQVDELQQFALPDSRPCRRTTSDCCSQRSTSATTQYCFPYRAQGTATSKSY
ncbi:hypothetical protein NYA30BAC_02057 [Halomonas sp. NYA30]